MPDGNDRYTTDLQDALFTVWAEADDCVGDYEIGERLAATALRVLRARADSLAPRGQQTGSEA